MHNGDAQYMKYLLWKAENLFPIHVNKNLLKMCTFKWNHLKNL